MMENLSRMAKQKFLTWVFAAGVLTGGALALLGILLAHDH